MIFTYIFNIYTYIYNYYQSIFLDNKNPGPDKYQVRPLMNGTGFNYVSKFKSGTAKSLYGKERDSSLRHKSKFILLITY